MCGSVHFFLSWEQPWFFSLLCSCAFYRRPWNLNTEPVNADFKHGTFIGLFIYFIYLCGDGVKFGPVGSMSSQNTVIKHCVCNHKQLKGRNQGSSGTRTATFGREINNFSLGLQSYPLHAHLALYFVQWKWYYWKKKLENFKTEQRMLHFMNIKIINCFDIQKIKIKEIMYCLWFL